LLPCFFHAKKPELSLTAAFLYPKLNFEGGFIMKTRNKKLMVENWREGIIRS
jgi:hypothetical protein